MRLKAVYGAEYLRHFPDDESVRMAKREWAHDIGQYPREQIDKMFSQVRREMAGGNDDLRWLNIGAILGMLSSSWEHARIAAADREFTSYPRLENKTAKQEWREKQKSRLAQMRAEIGI